MKVIDKVHQKLLLSISVGGDNDRGWAQNSFIKVTAKW